MTFYLKTLGPYRIERSVEYVPATQDNSYAEVIRVRGSMPDPPYFLVPSHLYKYSESELGLYLNDRKNLWRALGKLLNVKIDISDREIMLHFPVSLFREVAGIVPFVRKRGSGKLSPEATAMRDALNAKRHTGKIDQIKPNLIQTVLGGNITLDTFGETIRGEKDGGPRC